MRETFILFLKKFPLLHQVIKTFYWKCQSLKAHIFGTKIEEKKWFNRPLSLRDYYGGIKHPHRLLLIKEIGKFLPLANILEIGCGYGANLYLLAKKFPNVEIKGIDINPIVVQRGNKWLMRKGLRNVKIFEGKADDLRNFLDKSIDVILTDSVLIYIGPDKIKKVIKEMLRVARKGLILVEWHENSKNDIKGLGIYHFGHWKRNYLNLFKQFVPEESIRLIKLPKQIFNDENWKTLGYIIEIII